MPVADYGHVHPGCFPAADEADEQSASVTQMLLGQCSLLKQAQAMIQLFLLTFHLLMLTINFRDFPKIVS